MVLTCRIVNGRERTSRVTEPSLLDSTLSKDAYQKYDCYSVNLSYSCPVWAYCNRSRDCMCGETPGDFIECDLGENKKLSLADCTCATYNEVDSITEAGKCVYTCGNDLKYHGSEVFLRTHLAHLNEYMCGSFNRTGTLCGKCKDGYYPLAYSFDMTCIQCPNGKANWWKFVLVSLLPLTVFYFVVLFFNINVSSSHLHGFVLYSQAVTVPAIARSLFIVSRESKQIHRATAYIGSIYGIWNLDFFRFMDLGICLKTSTLQSLP